MTEQDSSNVIRTVFLDLETTGLDPAVDEILEIGILNAKGEVLLDTLVRPKALESWPMAQKIHGISPGDVRDSPTLGELRSQIIEAVSGAQVVIYNAAFDTPFLNGELSHAADIQCAMIAFSAEYGEWSSYHGWYKFKSLITAAKYVNFEYVTAHRAIDDCRATRAVWRYLTDHKERARIDALRQGGINTVSADSYAQPK